MSVEFQALVNRMTNWQRSQWARAGYPGAARPPNHRLGQATEDLTNLRPFLEAKKATA
jgi:hypothetical protein